MIVEDGFGFSPDSGEFQIKDNKVYWEDGDITEYDIFRWMSITNPKEHYADWTDEKRAAVKAEYTAKYEESRRQQVAEWQASGDTRLIELDGLETRIIAAALRHYNDCGPPTSNADWGAMFDVSEAEGEFDILELANRIELGEERHG